MQCLANSWIAIEMVEHSGGRLRSNQGLDPKSVMLLTLGTEDLSPVRSTCTSGAAYYQDHQWIHGWLEKAG